MPIGGPRGELCGGRGDPLGPQQLPGLYQVHVRVTGQLGWEGSRSANGDRGLGWLCCPAGRAVGTRGPQVCLGFGGPVVPGLVVVCVLCVLSM